METQIKNWILAAISDDYEEFSMIVDEVTKWASELSLSVTPQEIARELESWIASGFAQAFLLSNTQPYATTVNFSFEDIGKLWFYVTPAGKKLVEENDRQYNS